MIKTSNSCADQPLSYDQIFSLVRLERVRTYASICIWSKHDQFHIQICMKQNWSNFGYVMKLRFRKTLQTNSKEWNNIEISFHSNEMMSGLFFIRMNRYRDHLSFQSNEMIVFSFNSHPSWDEFLALFSTRSGLFRGVDLVI